MASKDELKEVNIVYWRSLFVPIVVSLLIMAAIVVFITTSVGEPHGLLKRGGVSVRGLNTNIGNG